MGRTTNRSTSVVTRTEFNALSSSVAQILALLEGASEPVSLERKTAKKRPTKAQKARGTKAKARTAAKAKATAAEPKCVVRKTRAAFVAQNPSFAGKTTGDIQRALLEGESFEGNWTVGERTRVFFETGAYPESSPKAKAKKGGKKARKATSTKVTAAVKPEAKAKTRAEEPEYGTDAWIAWARPTDEGAPRRANGTAAPKSEWRKRIDLEASGKFDRHEVDAIVGAL